MDWQLVFNAINDPGMILDLENRILEVNERTVVLAGMSSDELIGRHCYEIFHGQPAPPADCPYKSLLASQKPQTCAMTVEVLDKIYMVSLSPLFNASGEMEKVLHISRDITAQQMASEDHAKLQTILDSAPLGIVFTKDRIINYVNQKVLDVSGYRAEEIIGKPSRIFFVSDEEFEKTGRLRSAHLEKADISAIETKFLCKDGKLIDFYLTSVPIHPGEPEKGFIVTITDISKLKESEAARTELQTKLMEVRKMEAIGTLAGGIAHDFNNALTCILANIELVKMDPTDHDVEDCVQAVEESAHRMAYLTKQLLAYARGGKYQVKEISLQKFIEKAMHELDYSIDEKIQIVSHLDCAKDRIMADSGQLEMVLNAIVTNAVEAIDARGKIEVSCYNPELTEQFISNQPGSECGPYVCFSVKDNGCGMSEEIRERIFEPFYSTKFAGRGLGMAVVDGIVKNHDGYVIVDSEPGSGTSVMVYLPLVVPEAAASPETAAKKTVLLVEDEEMLHTVEKKLLERLGYHVLLAVNGKQSLQMVKDYNGTIDVALVDVHLPDITADILYMKLIELCPAIKVLLCSGSALEWTAQKALNAGAEGLLQKPFSLQELKETIAKTINMH